MVFTLNIYIEYMIFIVYLNHFQSPAITIVSTASAVIPSPVNVTLALRGPTAVKLVSIRIYRSFNLGFTLTFESFYHKFGEPFIQNVAYISKS